MFRLFGLLPRLAVFFLVCGVPALLTLDALRTLIEFRQIERVLDGAAFRAEIIREAEAISGHSRDRQLTGLGLKRDLERWLLTLSQPGHTPFFESGLALLEFSAQPFVAEVIDAQGASLVQTAPAPAALTSVPVEGFKVEVREGAGLTRLYRAPLALDAGRGELRLWVQLPPPSSRIWRSLGFEWPLVLAAAAVFALAAAVFLSAWVTRRLRRIAVTADAWRSGHFELRIDDPAGDEIGALAAQLDTMPAALSELMAHRAERAGRQERERIARDLHDTIKQQAFALSMQLAALQRALPEPQREHPGLLEARALCAQIQRELSELLDDLRPLPDLDFAARLRARVEDWARRGGFPIDLVLDAIPPLPLIRQEQLLPALDEALANVIRHSGAARAEVRLQVVDARLMLRIQDNGRGGLHEGMGRGLIHLRERAAALPEGRFDWHSDAEGTRIELSWREDPA